MKIYTKTGDAGTTGLLFGGRVAKNSGHIELNGAVDEAQAALGVVRAYAGEGELDEICVQLERDMWILMAEVATASHNRHKLVDSKTRVAAEMVTRLEERIDEVGGRFDPPTEFVLPGQNLIAAYLDVARTVVRRAERCSVAFAEEVKDSLVQIYLNRLSDLLWTLARWQEGSSALARIRSSGTGSPESSGGDVAMDSAQTP
ncbi:MAG: cob(I)yrinic acid a,c-diamide adenosyltransferase [Ferrimicrobium sp.]